MPGFKVFVSGFGVLLQDTVTPADRRGLGPRFATLRVCCYSVFLCAWPRGKVEVTDLSGFPCPLTLGAWAETLV